MNEIEKLYNSVGILPRRKCEFYEDCPLGFGHSCNDCDIELTEFNSTYPPFTAEKQLKLIKWLAINKEDFGVHYRDYDEEYRWVCGCEFNVEDYLRFNEDRTFEEALAGLINNLWKDLTSEEQAEIRKILEE